MVVLGELILISEYLPGKVLYYISNRPMNFTHENRSEAVFNTRTQLFDSQKIQWKLMCPIKESINRINYNNFGQQIFEWRDELWIIWNLRLNSMPMNQLINLIIIKNVGCCSKLSIFHYVCPDWGCFLASSPASIFELIEVLGTHDKFDPDIKHVSRFDGKSKHVLYS